MTVVETPRPSRVQVMVQWSLGLASFVLFAMPYLRCVRGLQHLDPRGRFVLVANHVSLLDTILIGALCWRKGCYPMLTLGDKRTWQGSTLKALLSRHVGFLLDRDRQNINRITELRAFGRAGGDFHLLVFPEGTRGDGVTLGHFRPGIFHIAQEAQLPLVPLFLENMQVVSSKKGSFHPIAGLRKIVVHVGPPILPRDYAHLDKEELLETLRSAISAARLSPPS